MSASANTGHSAKGGDAPTSDIQLAQ